MAAARIAVLVIAALSAVAPGGVAAAADGRGFGGPTLDLLPANAPARLPAHREPADRPASLARRHLDHGTGLGALLRVQLRGAGRLGASRRHPARRGRILQRAHERCRARLREDRDPGRVWPRRSRSGRRGHPLSTTRVTSVAPAPPGPPGPRCVGRSSQGMPVVAELPSNHGAGLRNSYSRGSRVAPADSASTRPRT